MNGLDTTVLLGATVLAGTVLAARFRVAAPFVQLVLGLGLGFVPALRGLELPPETVLLIFLPAMLFLESLTTSLRTIRRDLRGIVLMSTVLVVVTALAVAGIATALGLPWPAALVLGAALAPPDAAAVAALGRTLPHRNFMLLKAESLTNDGMALVLYAIAVGMAVGERYTPAVIVGMVALSYLGGVVAGALVGGAACLVMRRLQDATAVNTALLLVPFAAYLLAESVHASGVLAVVAAGLIVAFSRPRVMTAASRRQADAAWPLGAALLNGALFVLIGVQVPRLAHGLDGDEALRLVGVAVAVWACLLATRFLFQVLSVWLIRALDRRPSQLTRRMSHRARTVSTVAGFRGAVSLAIALSIPLTTASGEPLPGRDAIVLVTGGVIVLTLLVQGPLLGPVARWARLPRDTTADTELLTSERAMAEAALRAVDEFAGADALTAEARERLVGGHHDDDADLRLVVLHHKRNALLRLRRHGHVDDSVARALEARLDLEELRLTGVSLAE